MPNGEGFKSKLVNAVALVLCILGAIAFFFGGWPSF